MVTNFPPWGRFWRSAAAVDTHSFGDQIVPARAHDSASRAEQAERGWHPPAIRVTTTRGKSDRVYTYVRARSREAKENPLYYEYALYTLSASCDIVCTLYVRKETSFESRTKYMVRDTYFFLLKT